MLRPGERTRRQRSTASSVYFVIDGEGRTAVGDTELRWSKHDTFCVPNWSWREHQNLSRDSEAFLFSITDAPTLEMLNLLRHEADGHEPSDDEAAVRGPHRGRRRANGAR
jgi:gentisate 1,2-dioxygenase